jgi:tetratricopeptide (TPR) repeat protein
MKKLVFASVMALACISLIYAPTLRAQDTDQITIKDPAEFNAYQMASTQNDPKAKAEALESFLNNYPQSVVKKAVLAMLIDTYQSEGDADKALSAASRLLQADPNNAQAIFVSVFYKNFQCIKTQDAQTCDDAATLAQKGLMLPKPAETSADDWKKLTALTYPIYHSAIATDDAISKKDFKSAVAEYKAELMLYTDEQTKTAGLSDTVNLGHAYASETPSELVPAIWFYARAWDFAPAGAKANVERSLEYYYKKYHGDLKGLDAIKAQAAATTFPPGTLVIQAAKTPAETIHDLIATTPDLNTLALADKETVLAQGAKDDADKLWALLKDKNTQVPGAVLAVSASVMKVIVVEEGRTARESKSTDFVVNLKAPVACGDIPAAGSDLKQMQDYIMANGVKDDTDKLGVIFADDTKKIKKIVIEPSASVIKMAVTQDAKTSKIPDFIVNLKTPVPCKEIPAVGASFGQQPAIELDGTYDTYRQIPATATMVQTAEIVLRDGFVQPEKKKPVTAHKPAAGHHTAN